MVKQQTQTVIIYTHPDCTYSSAAKIEFKERGISYKEIDVALHPEAVPELERLTGGERITPVIVENGQVTVGFKGIG